jgi:uncharacterized membrane protein (DUF485 family)
MAVGDTTTTRREQAPRTGIDAIRDVVGTDAYQRLLARRRGFMLRAAGLFYALLATFTVLAAWAHDFMATRITSGLTVGYLAALLVFVGVWAVVYAYSRTSIRVLDPLAAEARRAEEERRAR